VTKRALITGITGQDGSYLAELLLSKGYEVYGVIRRLSTPNTERIAHILPDIKLLLHADLIDQSSLTRALDRAQPDEVYNLAAMSHVGTSFSQPVATGEYNGLGAVKLLDACYRSNPKIRFYQASTSELFGNVAMPPQNEKSTMHPRSPYGTAKLYAHKAVANYREAYGMFACAGILFNHESPRRGLDFVTRKITHGVARIKAGLQHHLTLGNLNAYRDWGYAPEYVEAMWLMLQQEEPEDFVIATGETHSVGEFAHSAFEAAGIQYPYNHIEIDSDLWRPAEVNVLCGDYSKAKEKLGWEPKTGFHDIVKIMVEADMRLVAQEGAKQCVSI